jgi:hypothetical protein
MEKESCVKAVKYGLVFPFAALLLENIEETLGSLVSLLEAYIRRYPQEWHFWPGLQHFYNEKAA